MENHIEIKTPAKPKVKRVRRKRQMQISFWIEPARHAEIKRFATEAFMTIGAYAKKATINAMNVDKAMKQAREEVAPAPAESVEN